MTRTGIHKAVTVVLAVAVVALVVVLVGRGEYVPRPQGRGEAPRPSAAVSAPAVTSAAPVPVAVVDGLPGDGELLVPEQVAPGVYQSPGPSGRTACYAFAYDAGGKTVDQSVARGSTLLTVGASVRSVEVSGCQPFVKVR